MSLLEGLPSQTIYDLFVDDKGLLYLGTDRGLYSYNGVAFREQEFVGSLGSSVHSIQQAEDGTIWCKNFSNQLFYLKNQKLIAAEETRQIFESGEKNLVNYLVFNSELWILSEKSVYLIEPDGELKKILELDIHNPKQLFFSITVNPANNSVYIASNDMIFKVDPLRQINPFPVKQGQKEVLVFEDQVYYNLKGTRNEIWSLAGQKIKNGLSSTNTGFYSLNKTNGYLWMSSTNGLYQVNTIDLRLEKSLLNGKRITKVVEDLEGNLWISSLDEGLFLLPDQRIKRKPIEPVKANKQYNINRLAIDEEGSLYAGTTKGTLFTFDKTGLQGSTYFAANDSEIEHIYPIRDLIITSAGVFKQGDPFPVINAYFGKQVALDDKNNIAIASFNLAGVFSATFSGRPSLEGISTQLNSTEINLNKNQTELLVFRNKRARCIHFCPRSKQYYVGFSDGLYVFNLEGAAREIKTLEENPIIANFIIPNADHTLWVATHQEGLIQLKNDQPIGQFTKKEGLSGNQLGKLQFTNDTLWMLTETGIDYLDTSSKTIGSSDGSLGLKGIKINDFIIEGEKIWFGTSEGLIYSQKNILLKQTSPHFSLRGILQSGQEIASGEKLKNESNSINFLFETIFYKSMGDYIYEYMLEPYHTDWQQQPATQAQVNFLSLKSGDYQFKARIKTGGIETPIQTFGFQIQKPFWLKWWFYLLAFLVMSVLLTLVYKWAAVRTQKKQEIREQLALSQLTALRSQMNPHFMFNVMNAIQGLIYSNQKNKANEYIGTFSELMRKTLDVSAKKEITIGEEIHTINLYISLEKGRFDDETFRYSIKLPEEEPLDQYTIPSLIIQPFVENAVKHGLMHKRGPKELLLELTRLDFSYWKFVIEDNGIGREASALINKKISTHVSFASKAISNRIELINKLEEKHIKATVEDIKNSQNQSTGTRVTLLIPVKPLL